MTSHDPGEHHESIAKGAGFALLGFLLFSVHDVIVKTLDEFSVFQIMFFAVLFSYVPFATSLTLDRTPRSLRPVNTGWVFLRGFMMLASGGFAFAAFSMLPMVQVYVLLFLTPLIISLLAVPLLGEHIQIFRTGAIIVGLLGVIVVLRPTADTMELGHFFGLCAALCAALANVISRKVGRQENPGTMLVVPMLINVSVTGILTIFFYQPMTGQQLLSMFLIGFLALIGQFLLLCAYRSAPAYIVAPFQYSQIIWAVIFGTLIFGDSVDNLTIVGSAITIAAGLITVWRETRVSVNQPNLRTRNIRGGVLVPMQSVEQEEAELEKENAVPEEPPQR